jgi:hypothetical protein
VEPEDEAEAEEPKAPRVFDANTLKHGRAIGGAKALHAAGHITAEERDRHIEKARKAMKAPMGLR